MCYLKQKLRINIIPEYIRQKSWEFDLLKRVPSILHDFTRCISIPFNKKEYPYSFK